MKRNKKDKLEDAKDAVLHTRSSRRSISEVSSDLASPSSKKAKRLQEARGQDFSSSSITIIPRNRMSTPGTPQTPIQQLARDALRETLHQSQNVDSSPTLSAPCSSTDVFTESNSSNEHRIPAAIASTLFLMKLPANSSDFNLDTANFRYITWPAQAYDSPVLNYNDNSPKFYCGWSSCTFRHENWIVFQLHVLHVHLQWVDDDFANRQCHWTDCELGNLTFGQLSQFQNHVGCKHLRPLDPSTTIMPSIEQAPTEARDGDPELGPLARATNHTTNGDTSMALVLRRMVIPRGTKQSKEIQGTREDQSNNVDVEDNVFDIIDSEEDSDRRQLSQQLGQDTDSMDESIDLRISIPRRPVLTRKSTRKIVPMTRKIQSKVQKKTTVTRQAKR